MADDLTHRLIDAPGKETTQALFKERHQGVFWVDWREADNYLGTLVARALDASEPTTQWQDDKLLVRYRDRSTIAPLEGIAGEQDKTLRSLNEVLSPDFEIRWIRASEGGDTLAFMVLPAAEWTSLEAAHGAKVDAAFMRLVEGSELFGDVD